MELPYPRFIQNRPSGIDKLEGASQKRLSEVIASYIIENDQENSEIPMSRIIGIEGTWGSGKSNVVKMLETKLKEKYIFFNYDAWGHQEDLQRRSLLELLTAKLIDATLLQGKTTLKIKGGEMQDVLWQEKLKYLLARKTESSSKSFPQLSSGMKAVAIAAFLVPICTALACSIQVQKDWLQILLSVVLSLIPAIIVFCVWHCNKENKKKTLSEFLAIYNDKVKNEVTFETISEDEPTVTEFKAWMSEISKELEGKKKLVIVFDNMDRLPAEKVKQLWSSIHTFFAEDIDSDYKNVWAIIPFDRSHLACAFGNIEDKSKELANYFIEKTFPITFRVTPPIITDYRAVFNSFYDEAFGNTEDSFRDIINRSYRLIHREPNIRSIIGFINELVALKKEWGAEIPLSHIAVFILFKKDLTEGDHIVYSILSGDYLAEVANIIPNDESLQSNISALVYSINVDMAKQIPLTKYLQGCIKGDEDKEINKFSNLPHFDVVLNETIQDVDLVEVDKAIKCIAALKYESAIVDKVWEYLVLKKMNSKVSDLTFTEEYKDIIIHAKTSLRSDIISKFYNGIYAFEKFDAAKYYKSLHDLDIFLDENNIEKSYQIKNKNISPEDFVEYLGIALEDYGRYKVKTDNEGLISLITSSPLESYSYADVVGLLHNDPDYDFSSLKSWLKGQLNEGKSVTSQNVGQLLRSYDILCDESPSGIKIPTLIITKLLQELVASKLIKKDDGYYDILAMNICDNINMELQTEEIIDGVSKCIEKYNTIGNLVEKVCQLDNNALTTIVKNLILNCDGDHKLPLKKVLTNIATLKKRLDVDYGRLIDSLSSWASDMDTEITETNLEQIIPDVNVVVAAIKGESDLAKHISSVAAIRVKTLTSEELYSKRIYYKTDYWHQIIISLIDSELFKPLPENVIDFGLKLLKGIANDQVELPLNEYYILIIDRIPKLNLSSTMQQIRNDYCNGVSLISEPKFLTLECRLREKGSVEERAVEYTNQVLIVVIQYKSCRNLIFENMDFYSKLINSAGDDASSFKDKIKGMLDSSDEIVIQFAKLINVELDDEAVEDSSLGSAELE